MLPPTVFSFVNFPLPFGFGSSHVRCPATFIFQLLGWAQKSDHTAVFAPAHIHLHFHVIFKVTSVSIFWAWSNNLHYGAGAPYPCAAHIEQEHWYVVFVADGKQIQLFRKNI